MNLWPTNRTKIRSSRNIRLLYAVTLGTIFFIISQQVTPSILWGDQGTIFHLSNPEVKTLLKILYEDRFEYLWIFILTIVRETQIFHTPTVIPAIINAGLIGTLFYYQYKQHIANPLIIAVFIITSPTFLMYSSYWFGDFTAIALILIIITQNQQPTAVRMLWITILGISAIFIRYQAFPVVAIYFTFIYFIQKPLRAYGVDLTKIPLLSLLMVTIIFFGLRFYEYNTLVMRPYNLFKYPGAESAQCLNRLYEQENIKILRNPRDSALLYIMEHKGTPQFSESINLIQSTMAICQKGQDNSAFKVNFQFQNVLELLSSPVDTGCRKAECGDKTLETLYIFTIINSCIILGMMILAIRKKIYPGIQFAFILGSFLSPAFGFLILEGFNSRHLNFVIVSIHFLPIIYGSLNSQLGHFWKI